MESTSPVAGHVFREWQSDEILLGRASRGFMANIGKKKSLNRAEVAHNKTLVAPVIRHMGFLPFNLKWNQKRKIVSVSVRGPCSRNGYL